MNYELIDSGGERRLEKWAGILVDRPAVQATGRKSKKCGDWEKAEVFFDKEKGNWFTKIDLPDEWFFEMENLKCELKLSSAGQLGVFPEQLENWRWIKKRLAKVNKSTKVLNAFGYTGLSSLVASTASNEVEVWHVDAAKSAAAWAKQNAKLSGLEKNKIHWVVEDVVDFLAREVKRGHKYDGLILDPPAFGRSGKKIWKLEKDLPRLIELSGQLLVDDPVLFCLSWHAVDLRKAEVLAILDKLEQFKYRKPEVLDLEIPATQGHELVAGKCIRF